MNNIPLISVIVPNYNHSGYLDRRMKSILGQTYANFEVIILDDKSSDDSLEVISKYLNDERIRGPFVNDVNSGSPFLQWQKGIDLAGGEWVWIAESDDFADNHFLEKSIKCILENKAIASFSTLALVREDGFVLKCRRLERNRSYAPISFSLINCIGPLIVNTSSALFKREIAQKISREYTHYRSFGDVVFWTEFAKHGRICRCADAISYFTLHDESASGSARKTGKAMLENERFLEWGKSNGLINPLEYYLMVGDKLNLLTRYAHYESQNFQDQLIKKWSEKVRFTKLCILMYRICHKLFRSNYSY